MPEAVCNQTFEGTTSGTTADAYAVALDIDMRGFKMCTILVKNTHATYTMTYKIDGYPYYGGTYSIADVSATDITATNQSAYEKVDNKIRSRLKVSVQSKVAGNHATYNISYILSA